ncbi:hypothetical protein QCD66_23525 [Polymorphospora sp. A560]
MSKQTISTFTDKVLDGIAERQDRPLDRVYPAVGCRGGWGRGPGGGRRVAVRKRWRGRPLLPPVGEVAPGCWGVWARTANSTATASAMRRPDRAWPRSASAVGRGGVVAEPAGHLTGRT